MRRWFELHPSVLRAPDREDGGGGSDTHRVDIGAPHELGADDDAPDEPAAPKKSAAEIRSEELEQDLTKERQRREEAQQDADYWAARARRTAAAADDEPAPRRRAEPAPAAEVEMTPEQLVDGLNREGITALRKAGFISKAEFDEAIANVKTELTGTIKAERSDAEFGSRIAQEYPDIAADSRRVANGEKPETELFKRAGAIYRQAVKDDPSLEGSQGLLLTSARMADRELKAEGKRARGADDDDTGRPAARRQAADDDAQPTRRERISRQTPARGAGDDDTGRERNNFDDKQLTVMKHLGVKPEQFAKHRDAAPAPSRRR